MLRGIRPDDQEDGGVGTLGTQGESDFNFFTNNPSYPFIVWTHDDETGHVLPSPMVADSATERKPPAAADAASY